jgi:hypothetical protein
MLDFSMYQSGIDFKCPYSNRPFKLIQHFDFSALCLMVRRRRLIGYFPILKLRPETR